MTNDYKKKSKEKFICAKSLKLDYNVLKTQCDVLLRITEEEILEI